MTVASVPDAAHADWAGWAQAMRRPMLRFAQLHLSRAEDAEDVVQDALLALWEKQQGASAPDAGSARRYLFGILRNKIADCLRQRYRAAPVQGADSQNVLSELDDALFEAGGHWQFGVTRWSQPDDELATRQFFDVLDVCMHRLPAKPARVFSMKEFLEFDADSICGTLGLSKSDYWQCMSRARKQMQVCLQQHWFEGASR